jgi:hypothetical protein
MSAYGMANSKIFVKQWECEPLELELGPSRAAWAESFAVHPDDTSLSGEKDFMPQRGYYYAATII